MDKVQNLQVDSSSNKPYENVAISDCQSQETQPFAVSRQAIETPNCNSYDYKKH